MKRTIKHSERQSSRRRGALFHYYLAYLSLTSTILILAGMCLHTILQSEQTDQRIALFLNSLKRFESSIREDVNENSLTLVSDSKMTINRSDDIQIEWSADRGILTRAETSGTELVSTDRFVFPAGSRIEMLSREEGTTVIRIAEPSAFVKYSAVGSGGLNRNKPAEEALPTTPRAAAAVPVVEIILQSQTKENAVP